MLRHDDVQIQSLNIDNSIEFVDLGSRYNNQDVDYLEKSTGDNIFQTISKYIHMTNPREWLFIVFFASVITSNSN
jgi:hypothetical protein